MKHCNKIVKAMCDEWLPKKPARKIYHHKALGRVRLMWTRKDDAYVRRAMWNNALFGDVVIVPLSELREPEQKRRSLNI